MTRPLPDLRGIAHAFDPVERDVVFAEVTQGLFSSAVEGPRIGRYEVLERLGGGGQGVVHGAYDPLLQRKVVIKILGVDRDRGESSVRLRREALALARLSHPNVIAITDVGLWKGGVYIVMQYVPGQTLSQWLGSPRGCKEVLAMTAAAGRGLVAAHEQGILHRDFKPSNVWIGDDGVPRLLDFGLARFASREEPSTGPDFGPPLERDVTAVGQVMGTPRYMAPEQHEGARLTESCDQYSFCVTLFEALYGVPPFEGSTLEALFIAKTSGRLPDVPADRRVPSRVRRAIARGLQADPAQRWPSMVALLDALRPRRRVPRAPLVAAGCLLAGFSVSVSRPVASHAAACDAQSGITEVWSASRTSSVRSGIAATGVPFADGTSTRVAGLVDRWVDEWSSLRTDVCERIESDPDADQQMQCIDRARSQLDQVLDMLENADAALAERAVELVRRLPAPTSCNDIDGRGAQSDQIHRGVARARALQIRGDLAGADEVSKAALTMAQAQREEGPLAEAEAARGSVLAEQGRTDEGVELLERAYLDAVSARADVVAFEVALRLANVYSATRQDLLLARRWEQRAASVLPRSGARAEWTARLELARASRLLSAGDNEGALPHARTATEMLADTEHPEAVSSANLLSRILGNLGRADEAMAAARRADELAVRIHGAEHPARAATAMLLGATLSAAGDLDGSLEVLGEAVRIYRQSYGEDDLRLAETKRHRAIAIDRLGQRERAVAEFREVLDIMRPQLSPDDTRLAAILRSLSVPLHALGREREAGEAAREGLRIVQTTLGEEHPTTSLHHYNLAEILRSADPAAALEHYESALATADAALGERHYLYGLYALGAGSSHHALGQPEKAVALFRKGIEVVEASSGSVESGVLPDARQRLAAAESDLGARD